MWNFSRAVSWIENLSTTRRVHKYASNFFLDIAPLLHQKQVSFRLNTCYMELKWGGVQCPRICESLFIPSWDTGQLGSDGSGTRKPENPTRKCSNPTRPEFIFLPRVKPEPDPNPRPKPAGTRKFLLSRLTKIFSGKSPDFRSKIEILECKSTLYISETSCQLYL